MELKQRCNRLTSYFQNGSFELAAPLEAGENSHWSLACERVNSLGFSPEVSAVALAIVYDTLVQHGDGEEADSLRAIMHVAGPRSGWNERIWLERFLTARFKILLHCGNPASASRVYALRLLLQSHPHLSPTDEYERAIADAF